MDDKKFAATTTKQLDAVLFILWYRGVDKHLTFKDIAEHTYNHTWGEIPFKDIMSILKRLEKDGFLEYDDRAVTAEHPENRVYRLTFDGRFWHEHGGYEGDQSLRLAESIRAEKLEKTQMALQKGLVWLTAILAAGTVMAALYYGTELYWHYGWFHFWK